MVGSKSYRDGVASGINWRRALVGFKANRLYRARLKFRAGLSNDEWRKGFRIGYDYERRRK